MSEIQPSNSPAQENVSSSPQESVNDAPILLRNDCNGVVTLTLNRPDKYNALSEALLDRLHEELEQIAQDDHARVVVINANGKAFCAGHDLKQMRKDSKRADLERLFARCSTVMQCIGALPQPVIAAVNGVATAAGCQLVATCDLAITSDQARFAVSGINIGLFCSTPAVALSRAVGKKQALEMLMLGDFIDAHKAADIGLVNRVVHHDSLAEETETIATLRSADGALNYAL